MMFKPKDDRWYIVQPGRIGATLTTIACRVSHTDTDYYTMSLLGSPNALISQEVLEFDSMAQAKAHALSYFSHLRKNAKMMIGRELKVLMVRIKLESTSQR